MSKATQAEAHHEQLMGRVLDQLRMVFEQSEQPMYIYLDDTHKACNQKLAVLLGYRTPEEWARVEEFEALVADTSAETLVTAYRNAMTRKIGSTIEVTWKRKNGDTVGTTVILVPVAYDGHVFALHFLSPRP